jgi:hypothetical protein
MKSSVRICQPLLLCLGLALPMAAQEGTRASRDLPETSTTRISGTVEGVDLQKRELTLRTGLGIMMIIPVDKRVQRLNEIALGDKINVDYRVSVATEIRQPTAQEMKDPITVASDTTSSPPGTQPTGEGMRVTKAVTTVEGIDRPTRMISLKGPRGNVYGVRTSDLGQLEKLKLGDKVVVYFTEALAVSVEKQAKEKESSESPP